MRVLGRPRKTLEDQMSQDTSKRTPVGRGSRSDTDAERFVEIFRIDNDIVAGLVVDEILGPAGIHAVRHDRRSHSIPAPASMPGSIGIAVTGDDAAKARALILEARKDGVLLDEGQLIEDSST